jgi:preprotein translocase subunit SecD
MAARARTSPTRPSKAGALRAVFKRKAGLSGLFLCAAAAVAIMTGVAASEPLAVEIISATAGYDQRTREPIVEYKLSRASQKLFAEMTEKNVGRKMELRIDGQPVVAAVIREPILGGSGQISGGFTEQQTRDIAAQLSSGASRLQADIVD